LAAAKLGRLELRQFVRCEHPHWKACVHNSSSVEFIRCEQGSTVACVARATATATAAWGQRLLTRVTAMMICELSGALVRITASQHRRNYSIIVRATYGTRRMRTALGSSYGVELSASPGLRTAGSATRPNSDVLPFCHH